MQVWSVGKARGGFDGFPFAARRHRETGQMRLALNQYRADATGALAASIFGCELRYPTTEHVQKRLSAVCKYRLVCAVKPEMDRDLAHSGSLSSAATAAGVSSAPAEFRGDTIRWRSRRLPGPPPRWQRRA